MRRRKSNSIHTKTKTKKHDQEKKTKQAKRCLELSSLLIQQNTPHTHTIMFPYLPFCNPPYYSHLHRFLVSKLLCFHVGFLGFLYSDHKLFLKKILCNQFTRNFSPPHPFILSLLPFFYFSPLFLSNPSFSLPVFTISLRLSAIL